MLLPAGNASSIFGITNAAPTSRVPLSSSTTMTPWDAAKAAAAAIADEVHAE
jgi:hypothetical protein